MEGWKEGYQWWLCGGVGRINVDFLQLQWRYSERYVGVGRTYEKSTRIWSWDARPHPSILHGPTHLKVMMTNLACHLNAFSMATGTEFVVWGLSSWLSNWTPGNQEINQQTSQLTPWPLPIKGEGRSGSWRLHYKHTEDSNPEALPITEPTPTLCSPKHTQGFFSRNNFV